VIIKPHYELIQKYITVRYFSIFQYVHFMDKLMNCICAHILSGKNSFFSVSSKQFKPTVIKLKYFFKKQPAPENPEQG